MSNRFQRIALAAVCVLCSVSPAWGAHAPVTRFALKRSEWVGVQTARHLIRDPGVSRAVRAWMGHPRQSLVLLYPVGVEGRVWASELANWLVALGVPRRHLVLRPHLSSKRNILWLELERRP